MAAEAAKAVTAAADAFTRLAAERSVAATDRLMANIFNKKGAAYEALKFTTKSAASLKASLVFEDFMALVESMEGLIPGGDINKADAAALRALTELGTAASKQIVEGQFMPALRSAKGILAVFQDLGLQSGEAIASFMVANACLVMGEPKDSMRSANQGLTFARVAGLKKAESAGLLAFVGASVMKRDVDGALVAAQDLAKLISGDRKKEGMTGLLIARLHLVNDDQSLALQAAREAQTVCKSAGYTAGAISAIVVEYESYLAQGKPATALKAASDAVAMSRDKGVDKKLQAVAQLLVGDAQPATKESLDGATSAVTFFKEQGNKEGQAAALVSLANSRFSQEKKEADTGLQAAQEAAALFKDAGNRSGEALAMSTAAIGLMLKQSSEEAEKTAREALNLFRDAADAIGENFATSVLKNCKAATSGTTTARLLIDDTGVAHIEVNENASSESLEAVIAMLHAKSGSASVILLHLEGAHGLFEGMQNWAVSSGTFVMGLRTLGLPVVCACWGKIAGPAWGLVFCADYRIAATNTTFMLPLWGPPEVLADIVGPQTAVALCMQQGPASALVMLEQGIIHQCQRGKEDTRKAAGEMAKRIAKLPSLPVHNTMNLMTPPIEKFSLAAAKGNVRW